MVWLHITWEHEELHLSNKLTCSTNINQTNTKLTVQWKCIMFMRSDLHVFIVYVDTCYPASTLYIASVHWQHNILTDNRVFDNGNLCGNQGRLRDVSTTSNTADIKSALFGVVEMSRKRPWWEFSIFCHTSLLYFWRGPISRKTCFKIYSD